MAFGGGPKDRDLHFKLPTIGTPKNGTPDFGKPHVEFTSTARLRRFASLPAHLLCAYHQNPIISPRPTP